MAGFHGYDNLFVSALDELELHFRLAVCGQGSLSALRAVVQDAVSRDVHHLEESRLGIVGQLPEVAAVGAVDISPHSLAFEGGIHGFGGMDGGLLIDGLAILVEFSGIDACCVCPLQSADDSIVAVGYGKCYKRGHDSGIAFFYILDDGIDCFHCEVFYVNFFEEYIMR